MLARSALSTAFWSLALLLDGFFFCDANKCQRISHHQEGHILDIHLWLLSLLEELFFTLFLAIFLPCKVVFSRGFVHNLLINALQIYHCRCGNDISGIDPSERNTINLERTGNKKNTLREMLEEDNSLATEAAS
jgi:hypothetical protein